LKEQNAVKAEDEIGFVFVLLIDLNRNKIQEPASLKRKASETEEDKKLREEKDKIEAERMKKMDEMGEQLDCQICYDIMHQAVSVMPCVHNFCGGCFSDWIMRQQDCPTCREEINGVSKSAAINSMVDNFIMMNPPKKRDPEVLSSIAERNLFTKKLNFDKAEIINLV